MTRRETLQEPEVLTPREARQATGHRLTLRILVGSLFVLAVVFSLLYAAFVSGSVPVAG